MSNYNKISKLWDNHFDSFFREKTLVPQLRKPKECVATTLAILAGTQPNYFYNKINTQDPHSWSEALKHFGMKLAYCPTDIRKLKYYIHELQDLDDLFLLSFYIPKDCSILSDPCDDGWLASSHVVILHRANIIDTKKGIIEKANQSDICEHYTKRILRVVNVDNTRGA